MGFYIAGWIRHSYLFHLFSDKMRYGELVTSIYIINAIFFMFNKTFSLACLCKYDTCVEIQFSSAGLLCCASSFAILLHYKYGSPLRSACSRRGPHTPTHEKM